MDEDKLVVPEPDGNDVMHIAITTALNTIPFLGAGELFKFIVSPSIEKRREQWMRNVAEAVSQLQTRAGFDFEALRNSEEFITLLIKASQIAVKTHVEEKRLMLRNSIVNSAFQLNFNTADNYLSLVDRLNSDHIAILKYVELHEHDFVEVSHFGGLMQLLTGNGDLTEALDWTEFRACMKDLEQAGLMLFSEKFLSVHGEVNYTPMLALGGKEGKDLPHARITTFGSGFLSFIQEPKA